MLVYRFKMCLIHQTIASFAFVLLCFSVTSLIIFHKQLPDLKKIDVSCYVHQDTIEIQWITFTVARGKKEIVGISKLDGKRNSLNPQTGESR